MLQHCDATCRLPKLTKVSVVAWQLLLEAYGISILQMFLLMSRFLWNTALNCICHNCAGLPLSWDVLCRCALMAHQLWLGTTPLFAWVMPLTSVLGVGTPPMQPYNSLIQDPELVSAMACCVERAYLHAMCSVPMWLVPQLWCHAHPCLPCMP